MKYALLIYVDPDARTDAPAAGGEVMDSWLDYTAALSSAGAALGAEALRPVDTATTVRSRGGERLLTDGPFIETKEHLLGFYLLDVPDLDAALDWPRGCRSWATARSRCGRSRRARHGGPRWSNRRRAGACLPGGVDRHRGHHLPARRRSAGR